MACRDFLYPRVVNRRYFLRIVKGVDSMLTEKQKEQILKLKSKGKTFTEIAARLGVSKSTVKSSFYRLSSKKTSNCKNCGTPLPDGSARRVFCCDKCRLAYFKTHTGYTRTQYKRKCPCCGASFTSSHGEQKYCSHPCYIKSRYKLNKNQRTKL